MTDSVGAEQSHSARIKGSLRRLSRWRWFRYFILRQRWVHAELYYAGIEYDYYTDRELAHKTLEQSFGEGRTPNVW